MQSLKERWQKLAPKTRKQLIIIAVGTIVIAAGITLFLFLSKDRGYSTLFTGLNQEEAQQVVSYLQESDIDYQYNDTNGSISVPAATVDQTRAQLVSEGYPKSGFSYDIYLDNTGLMSTESDKERYTLYELQNRLGAQIRLFDGVKEATVTINEATQSKYALSDASQMQASASVSVTMENGRTLSEEGADAIRRLISTAVRGMEFTGISVFDTGTMREVGGSSGDSEVSSASDLTELTSLVESNIASNVRRVLEKIYGEGRVEVAVKGRLNMESLIQESTTYSTPEKINEQDKTGLLFKEDRAGEGESTPGTDDGGVAGSDANADVPRYPTETGDDEETDLYGAYSWTREWLFNTVKEQRQIDPGVLESTMISIVIDTDDMTVPEADLRNLVAKAAGIAEDDEDASIAIVRTLSLASKEAAGDVVDVIQPEPEEEEGLPLLLLIALAALGVLIFLLIILLILRGRRKKKRRQEEEEQIAAAISPGELGASQENWSGEEFPGGASQMVLAEDEEMSQNEEILKLKMQRNIKLKQNIGEIVDQNPQIVAKLVQGWLNSEEGDKNGGGRSSDKQKHR
ncbi:MAG: flagellar M-ring protein FliF [Lachnospiraceae bacterium]|nr:flagellar M-ring protein FliF [Lachnospiraceae bacterium]